MPNGFKGILVKIGLKKPGDVPPMESSGETTPGMMGGSDGAMNEDVNEPNDSPEEDAAEGEVPSGTVDLTGSQFPQIKSWQNGKEYNLKVKQIGSEIQPDGEHKASFEVMQAGSSGESTPPFMH